MLDAVELALLGRLFATLLADTAPLTLEQGHDGSASSWSLAAALRSLSASLTVG